MVVLVAGCGGGTPLGDDAEVDAGCPDPSFLGDPGSPPVIEPIAIQFDGSFTPIEDGQEIALFTPLAGGKVMLTGALLSNVALEDCGRLRIGALFRDPTDPDEAALKSEERSVRYEPMAARPGWAAPRFVNDVRNMGPNLEVCGFSPYPRDSDACEWIVEIRYEDPATETVLASVRRRITPVCPEDDPGDPDGISPELELENCQCQCAANYEKGRCTPENVADWVAPPAVCE